jgi:hypothetical protein
MNYLKAGVGRRLSRLGERLNIHCLTYNPLQFRRFHEGAVRNAPGVIGAIHARFPEAQRYLDVGSGSGAFSAECNRLGLITVACEHGASGRRMAARQGVDCRPFDLTHDPPAAVGGPFDVSICFEVAEHLPPSLGDRLVLFVAGQSPTVVFTAAHPGQGGTGHINEQPKEYWIERFERAGMRYDAESTAWLSAAFVARKVPDKWFEQNITVFRKAEGRPM